MRVNKNQDKEKDKIVLTGGHAATTALATVEELIRRGSWDIYWIGAKTAIGGKNIPTMESEIFPMIGIRSFRIISGRIQRKLTFWTLPLLMKIPFGFIHAIILLLIKRRGHHPTSLREDGEWLGQESDAEQPGPMGWAGCC